MGRLNVVEKISAKKQYFSAGKPQAELSSEQFGLYVFNRRVMQRMLPREIYKNVVAAMDGKEKIREENADPIAVAMKEWAMSHGATHFTHWFQPLTGTSAEKHDAFIEWTSEDQMIEQLTGKQLVQGEPDASSFPSGGLRSTYEARGYTGWDPSSPAFIWKEGDGVTLCIPSVFFSWTGAVLDTKIPLHRSEKRLSAAVLKLLKLTGVKAERVYTTLGLEQEYFVVDRNLRNLRPDLLLLGKTVFGASPAKGQELQDHYFGSVRERVLNFMHDFERAALKLGIPVKTRHNEVAPGQYEVAPVFERATLAIDHNIQMMELMRKVAIKHDLAVLLHEKPFENLNGSGKHCNWSITTDTRLNLLDPTDNPGNNFHFLVLMTAFIEAVQRHGDLIRASIGSASNDYRLGGHEAPPAIMSIYLGEAIEAFLNDIEVHGIHQTKSQQVTYDLGILGFPDLKKDYTDRNRTSPMAFTGAKFECRALGSSANPAMAATILNAAVAESLENILDEVEQSLKKESGRSKKAFMEAVIPVIQRSLKRSKGVRFAGDNYAEAWVKEAKKRGLPNFEKSIEAYETLREAKSVTLFQGILSEEELKSRVEILLEQYVMSTLIEVNLMIELCASHVIPAAVGEQKRLASALKNVQTVLGKGNFEPQLEYLKSFTQQVNTLITRLQELKAAKKKVEKESAATVHVLFPAMLALREVVDQIEGSVEDAYWPLPKYRELLFLF